MPLLLASITGPLVNFATSLISSLGLVGVALMTLSTGVIGIPGTEPTMLFAGFDVFRGNLGMPGIIIAGTIGDVAGACIAYAIGYYGRRELLERQGSKLHVSSSGLDRAHRWFERWGTPVIFISRLLPFIRAAFPYAAGVAEMPFWRFFPLTVLGSLIWISALGTLGREVGSQWQSWRHHLEYVDYLGAAVLVALIVYGIVRWRRSRVTPGGTEPGPAVDALSD
ncbi:MAG TPA: DedA family protein [Solirubrobacteraceae bacterium]|nr:DedA family protein [Solirubrobacteraceae bacterium]